MDSDWKMQKFFQDGNTGIPSLPEVFFQFKEAVNDAGFSCEEDSCYPIMDKDALKSIQLPEDIYLSTIRSQMEQEFEPTVEAFLQSA